MAVLAVGVLDVNGMSQANVSLTASSWFGTNAHLPDLAWLGRAVTLLLLGIVVILVVSPIAAVIYGALHTRAPGDPRAVFTRQKMIAAYDGLFTGGWTQSATLHTLLLAIPVPASAALLSPRRRHRVDGAGRPAPASSTSSGRRSPAVAG